MSFSQTVKEEILNNIKKIKVCCASSFLTAVLKSIGSICVDNSGYGFSIETDNGEFLMYCAELSQWAFNADCAVLRIDSGEDGKNPKYMGRFDLKLGEKLNLIYHDGEGLHVTEKPDVNLSQACCRRAFVQGLFLSCGSVSIPESSDEKYASKHSNYHLELRFSNAEFANFVQNEFAELNFRQITRKNSVVLYLKDSEKISDFFTFVDAVNSMFTVANVIIGRSYRNVANREKNCIESNINKAILASEKHVAAIAKIRQAGKFNLLAPPLQQIAILRESDPYLNLAELAATLGISKSGANHRLAKLLEIAEDL